MQDYEFSVLIKLYLFGKKLQAIAKNHNSDLMSQSIILRMVNFAPQRVGDIAEIFSIKVSAATTKICDMEKKGLLMRKLAQDKRSHLVEITEKGKKQLKSMLVVMSARSSGHTIGLTASEATMLEKLISRIRLEFTHEKKDTLCA